jgi:hypothetical protein
VKGSNSLQLAASRCNLLQLAATKSHEKAKNERFGATGCKWAQAGAAEM